MIEKSIFQQRINEPTKKKIEFVAKQNKSISLDKNCKVFRDISNQLEHSQALTKIIDYKSLYQIQQEINEEQGKKIVQLEQKIKQLSKMNIELKNELDQKYSVVQNQTSLTCIPSKKKSLKQFLFEQIQTFKSNLPNSMKVIEFEQLDNFQSVNALTDQQIMSRNEILQRNTAQSKLQNKTSYQIQNFNDQKSVATSAVTLKIINDQSLIDCLAVYGLSEEAKFNSDQEQFLYQGQLTYCSKTPHQIIKHSSKLVFPQKFNKSEIKILHDQDAVQKAVSLINQTIKSFQLKAFTLIFQPSSCPTDQFQDFDEEIGFKKQQSSVIDLINKQRRFYAICLPFQDFDLVQQSIKDRFADITFQNSLQEDIFKQNIYQLEQEQKQSQKSNFQIKKKNNIHQNSLQINKQVFPIPELQKEDNLYSIRVTKKIIVFFTKFPFLPFFQSLLINCLKQSFDFRKEQMKRNLTDLKSFDHKKTIEFLKTFYSGLCTQFKLNKKFESKVNQIFQIKFKSAYLNRYENISLELSKSLLKNYYSQIWAYPILKLFTLDNFLDTFTLMMLQEKIIFVCQNQHILTSAVFLFTKVLIKPFNYPYPVVSMIPNQYDYFNAPFPIVYGCLNSKANLIREKIPKIYKNVYVILQQNGVEIYSHKNLSKILMKKSPRLRDKLLPTFIKIEQQQKQFGSQKQSNIKSGGFSSFLGFGLSNPSGSNQNQGSKAKFNFTNNNRQLSHQIAQKVYLYLNGIKEKLPSRGQVGQIKKKVEKQIKNSANSNENKFIDIDKQTYQRIKNKLIKKTNDPFLQGFLETQIVGMQILR